MRSQECLNSEIKQSRQSQALAVLGTASDVGKSIVATALCRIFHDLGFKTAPFKAQNMANNSFVTSEGGEMGRAQVVQAEAACAEPHVDMNPVLLKPCTDTGAQVILHGQALNNFEAKEFFKDTSYFRQKSIESLKRLQNSYNMVIIEGAGSCAEVNLRQNDYVNFDMAHAIDCPVILVADIDRGGVFAQVIGSLAVMPEKDRKRVAGIIINRFRGDASLFEDGVQFIEEKTALPILGVIPYFRHISIEAEDGLPQEIVVDPQEKLASDKVCIAVLRLPHIANFTDFDSLLREPSVQLHYLAKARDLSGYDAVIIPGSKNVRFDLQWLRDQGWQKPLEEARQAKRKIIGICGGYQMLGQTIADPDAIEGPAGESNGFGFLNITTKLAQRKTLQRAEGYCSTLGAHLKGYEIHMGITARGADCQPFLQMAEYQDGAISDDSSVWGTYLHGCFDECEFRAAFLRDLSDNYSSGENVAMNDFKEHQYALLAEHFREHLDMEKLKEVCFGKDKRSREDKEL